MQKAAALCFAAFSFRPAKRTFFPAKNTVITAVMENIRSAPVIAQMIIRIIGPAFRAR
jgi:hypothetical protein